MLRLANPRRAVQGSDCLAQVIGGGLNAREACRCWKQELAPGATAPDCWAARSCDVVSAWPVPRMCTP